jgi:hypothetical protein
MRIPAEASEKVAHLLMDHRVMGDRVLEILERRGVGKFPVKEKVADLEEMRFAGQLIDRVAAMQKLALVAVDEGDGAVAGGGGGEARIVCEQPRACA